MNIKDNWKVFYYFVFYINIFSESGEFLFLNSPYLVHLLHCYIFFLIPTLLSKFELVNPPILKGARFELWRLVENFYNMAIRKNFQKIRIIKIVFAIIAMGINYFYYELLFRYDKCVTCNAWVKSISERLVKVTMGCFPDLLFLRI